MPKPLKDIDPEQVRKLAAIGCTHEEIASVVGCSQDTIARRFLEDVEYGRSQGKSSLRRKQWEMAMSGNVTMLVWLGKQYLGQSDKQTVENTFEDFEVIIGTTNANSKPAAGTSEVLE